MNNYPSVTAIIVNYRSAGYALDCIHSLQEQERVNLEIVVVDNASGDNSVQQIRAAYPDIKLIENPNNDGFARANNLAALSATGDFILVINPDIRLLSVDAVAGLAAYLANNPEIGVLGPDIIESRRNKRNLPKRRYPLQGKLKKNPKLIDLPGEFAWILGACMLFRSEVYRQIGGFDNDFFLYGEDADICLRLRQAGYSVGWAPEFKVDHWAGASESGSRTYDTRVRKKRGYYQFCLKHYVANDLLPVLRREYWKCGLKLWGLSLRSRMAAGKVSKTLASAVERNQAERDVLDAILSKIPEINR